MHQSYKFVTAEQAASHINNGDVIGFSGFTPAGCPKALPIAIAQRAQEQQKQGKEFKVGIYTGASTGDSLDGSFARANCVKFRTPYQSNKDMRTSINNGDAPYFDMHLSILSQELRYKFLPKPKFAILEVADFNEKGELVLTTACGIAPTIANLADYIILEWNTNHPKELRGFHDIYEPLDPPHRKEIPIYKASDRIGTTTLNVDPKKILCIVETNRIDEVSPFVPVDDITKKIGTNVALFLSNEIKEGRIPKEFLPIQSGVGNIANAVLAALGANPNIPPFEMYTEVIQDSVVELLLNGNITFASGCSLTLTNPELRKIYENLEYFRDKLVLRPQEISNNPEVARRIGIISINTAIEVDLFGNVNSTNILGKRMMNGIGGSGDFTRNAYISIFTTPSIAKNGDISSIVPMVPHVDHSEHSVKIIVTEQGVADLRGKSPFQRAHEIINNCVHPDFRESLREYLSLSENGHTRQNLNACYAMHKQLSETGSMRNIDWDIYK